MATSLIVATVLLLARPPQQIGLTARRSLSDAAAAKGQQTIAPPAKKPKVMTEASNAPPAPKAKEAAKPPVAPAEDEVEDKEVEDWYAKATTPPVPAS